MKVIKIYSHQTTHNIKNAVCLVGYLKQDNLIIIFIKNYKKHNSKFAAIYYTFNYMFNNSTKDKFYRLFGKSYACIKSNKSWQKQAKQLIKQNKLKVFK